MKDTMAFHMMALHRDFLAYTTESLKELGLSFGQMPFILYAGKHPGCTQADLTRGTEAGLGIFAAQHHKISGCRFYPEGI